MKTKRQKMLPFLKSQIQNSMVKCNWSLLLEIKPFPSADLQIQRNVFLSSIGIPEISYSSHVM